MIITRTPFRISLGGGGTDIPSFYREEPGCVLSLAINKHMYIAIHPYFEPGRTFIKYSRTEIVESIGDIRHPIVREVLQKFNVEGVDITSIADILAGSGLGSSSTYTVGLLHALYAYTGQYASREKLAREACDIEINRLGEPIGKQDQYAAAFGGINFITFHQDERVEVEPLTVGRDVLEKLRNNLVLLYLGNARSAGDILKVQTENIRSNPKTRAYLRSMADIARRMRDMIYENGLDDIGGMLHESWMMKRELAAGITSSEIDRCYSLAMNNGALGGKLLGAGGGGFLLLYCRQESRDRLAKAMSHLRTYSFDLDFSGTSVIYTSG